VPASTVLLLENDTASGDVVSSVLSAVGYSVTTVTDAGETFVKASENHLVIIDVVTGDRTAFDVCREIRSRHPEIACIMLTSFADDDAVYAAILAGAAGYLLKQVRGHDLVDAIRRVAGGASLLDPEVTTRVLERLRHKDDDDPLAALTDQERTILELIAEGLTNRQIGERMFLAEKTVKNYVSNMFSKLGMSRRTEAAAYAARLAERRDRHDRRS